MSCSSSYGGAEHIRACKVHGFTIGHVGRFRVSGTSTRSLTRARVVPCQTKPWRALRFRVQDGRWQRARGCPRHRPSAVRHPPAAVGAAGQPPACQPVWCMQAGRRPGGRAARTARSPPNHAQMHPPQRVVADHWSWRLAMAVAFPPRPDRQLAVGLRYRRAANDRSPILEPWSSDGT